MTQFISPKSKLYSHLPTIEAIRQGKRPPPINVELYPTFRCDLKCHGCHFAYTHTRGPWVGHADKPKDAISGGDLLDYDLGCDIFEQLATYGVKSLTFTGGGEPTIHPHFDGMIRKANDVGLQLGIYSHGGFIQGERAEWMKEHFEWIYFSLDACTADSYKEHKGVNRFERVCANIEAIARMEGKSTIGVGFLVHNDNWRDIHDMVRLARSLGADYVQFRPMVQYSQDAPGKLAEDTDWVLRAIGRLQAYKGDKFVIADVDRFRSYMEWQGHPYKKCFWSAIQTVISPNGKVWRCTNKTEHSDALLGDLSIESFATLWERSGGPCTVSETCRLLCRGWSANQVLDNIMTEQKHPNFP